MPVSQFFQNTTLKAILCQNCSSEISATVLDAPIEAVRSCELLTEREAAELQSSCVADEAEIAAYDAAIGRAQAIIDELREQRRCLDKIRARKRALLAPIWPLPNEILGQIISLAVMRTFRKYNDISVMIRHPVLQVCQRWRHLAIEMPELWTLCVMHTSCANRGWFDDLRKFLSRSKDLPIDLNFTSGHSPWHNIYSLPHVRRWHSQRCAPICAPAKYDAVDLFVDAAPRWRSIRIADLSVPTMLLQASPHLGSLETLVLQYETGPEDDNLSLLPLFSDAPKLTVVRMRVPSFLARLPLPWSSLTLLEMVLTGETASELESDALTALHQCQALESLYFCPLNALHVPDEDAPIELPNLQLLFVQNKGHRLLHRLKAPVLHKIIHEIEPARSFGRRSSSDYLEDTSPLIAFGARNAGAYVSLSSLSFAISWEESSQSTDQEMWMLGLRPYTGIRYLSVSEHYCRRALCALLQTLAHTLDFLPHLKRLHLPTLVIGGGQSYSKKMQEAFMEFIANRGADMEELEVGTVEGEELQAYCTRQTIPIYANEPEALRRV
ncbi:hypothetical protein GGF50DRAFT_85539 [Schizophyllum commune]